MHFVYILRSIVDSDQNYVGLTNNVENRLNEQNAGKSRFTKKHLPWEITSIHRFPDREMAALFEKHLKSGSGRAFAKKHLR